MKAVWAIGHIATDIERTQAVDFIRELGFNTLITGSATPEMVAHARKNNIHIIAVITPNVNDAFVQQHPQSLQKMRDFEYKLLNALQGQSWDMQTAGTFRWHPILQSGKTLCFERPESQIELKRRVEQALALADGVALDGFGFLNHYACFCNHCQSIRTQMPTAHPDQSEYDILTHMSEQTLINIHRQLYDHAKTINSNAIVTNHVWPPFRPNEYIGHKLKLDYCTQTISWFYPPFWPIERIEMEAAEMKRLENRNNNQFVPFIGINSEPDLVRPSEQIAKELDIALKYGNNSLVVSRLTTLQQHPKIASVVKTALKK